MKKLSILLFVLSVSFSFAQTKETEITIDSSPIGAVVNEEDVIYSTAGIEVKPEFPGGMQKFMAFVSKNYKIPVKGLKGKVYVTFVINSDGAVSNIKVLRDIGYGTGEEAVRVLKLSPKWIPGELNGKKIRCSYNLPIAISN